MKKLIYLIVLCTCGSLCETTSAQVSFKINIGRQPIWSPIGYDNFEYYNLPDVEANYYVPTRMCFYMKSGRWISGTFKIGKG